MTASQVTVFVGPTARTGATITMDVGSTIFVHGAHGKSMMVKAITGAVRATFGAIPVDIPAGAVMTSEVGHGVSIKAMISGVRG